MIHSLIHRRRTVVFCDVAVPVISFALLLETMEIQAGESRERMAETKGRYRAKCLATLICIAVTRDFCIYLLAFRSVTLIFMQLNYSVL